jgi:hypothetical protein
MGIAWTLILLKKISAITLLLVAPLILSPQQNSEMGAGQRCPAYYSDNRILEFISLCIARFRKRYLSFVHQFFAAQTNLAVLTLSHFHQINLQIAVTTSRILSKTNIPTVTNCIALRNTPDYLLKNRPRILDCW